MSEEEPQQSALAIHRLVFNENDLSFENLPRGENLRLNNSPLPCILGSSLHLLNSGFLVFGGARRIRYSFNIFPNLFSEVGPSSVNVWHDLSGITSVEPTNHLMFLQI